MISVIIKTRNSEDTLCAVLESVKEADEIIIADEHSTDDTVEFAKEYKARVVYVDRCDMISSLNSIAQNAQGDWIYYLEDNEITPERLWSEILRQIETAKKNTGAFCFPRKSIYLEKEIKSARKRAVLKLFKKGACEFAGENLRSVNKKLKIRKINKSFRAKNICIIKYKKRIYRSMQDILDEFILKFKNTKSFAASVFFKPSFRFISLFFLSFGFLDGSRGFIYAIEEGFKSFIFECAKFEKGKEDDIQ